MRPDAPPLLARVFVAAALTLGAWAGVALVDVAIEAVQKDAEAAVPSPSAPPAAALPAPGHVFVLLIDSLRAPRAAEMPTVRALRPRSVFVHVQATRDAATVPSVRAAFTGRTQRSIFAFVRNFVTHGGTTPSLLSQAAAQGLHIATFSDGAFYEISPATALNGENDLPPGEDEERQVRAFHRALALYQAGGMDLVIFHLTIVDHVAHALGTKDPAYEHAFAVADQLVREADAAVLPADTLVVMGDHGHDETGRHFPGLDVPTVAVYRGPGFKAGAEIGPVPLTIHRYLMSWALGLPLSPEYRGVAVPQVLVGPPPPLTYRAPPPELSTSRLHGERLVWMRPLALLLAALAAFGAWTFAPTRANARRAVVGALVGATVVPAWGALLAYHRLREPPASTTQLLVSWLLGLLVAAGLVASGRLRRMTATWIVFAAPALLLYASAAWDGWAAIMTPAWLTAVALLLVDWARRRLAHPEPPLRRGEGLALLAVPALAVLLLPFFFAETDGVRSGDWRGYLSSNRMVYWIVVSTGARLVIFLRPRRGVVANVLGLALVALFSVLSFGDLPPAPTARLAVVGVLGGAALAMTAWARRTLDPEGPVPAIAAMLANATLLLAYRSTVVLGERTFLQMELLLAALVLTARAGVALGRREDRPSFAAWLEGMALVVAAWSTLALTLSRLEWKIFYTFFPPLFVEHHVGLLLPAIVGRYALPLILARRLLAEATPDAVGSTWRRSAGLMTIKMTALLLGVVGAAVLDPSSEPFVAAVQCVLTFSVLSLALVFEPWRPALAGIRRRSAAFAALEAS